MTRFIACLAAFALLAPAAAAQQHPTPETAPAAVLFWTPADRERAFRTMETFLPHATVSRGHGPVRPLLAG